MLQHILGRWSVSGVLLGLLVLSAAGCQSDKPWPYSPCLGPEQPACFPCTLWGGYYPTCWDEWPGHPCPCPTPAGVPQKPAAGKPGAGSPFKPEAMPHKPKPPAKLEPKLEPKPEMKPEPKPPAKPEPTLPLPPDPSLKPAPGAKPGPDPAKRSAFDVPEPAEEPASVAPQPTAVPEEPPESPGDGVEVQID